METFANTVSLPCLSPFRLPVSVVLGLEAGYGFHVIRADQAPQD